MDFNKKMLIISLAIVMSMCIGPAFADPESGTTNPVSVDVTDTVSILVTGDASFGSLAANNIQSPAQTISIITRSNVPIDVNVNASEWNGGNMPLSALQFGTTNTPMTTTPQSALSDIPAANLGGGPAKSVNLYMQVPFGTTSQHYTTTVVWTASKHGS